MSYSDPSLLQADLIAGSSTINNSAASTPIVTVPAGRIFRGCVTLTICDTAAAAATFSTISALTAGTNVYPVVGSVLLVAQTHPGGTSAGTMDVTVPDIVVRAPAANSVTINAQLSAAATTLNGTCSITGILVG
jgi:hypothetical protein